MQEIDRKIVSRRAAGHGTDGMDSYEPTHILKFLELAERYSELRTRPCARSAHNASPAEPGV